MDKSQKKILAIFFSMTIAIAAFFAVSAYIIKGYTLSPRAEVFGNLFANIGSIFGSFEGAPSSSNEYTSIVSANPGVFSALPPQTSTPRNSAMLSGLVFSGDLQTTSVAQVKTTPVTQVPEVLTGVPIPPTGTVIQNLGSSTALANWTAGSFSALGANNVFYTEDNQSLSLTTDGLGNPALARVVDQGPYNINDQYIEIWIRVSASANISELRFMASSDDFNSNYYTWKLNKQLNTSVDDSEIQAGEWVPIVLTFDVDGVNTIKTGNPNLDALNSFEIYAEDKKSGPLTVLLGGIAAVAEPPQGALTIVLDNGWISEYTLAMPTLAKYGFPAVIAEIPATANDFDFMSTAQLQYLQNDLGWDIACHTWDHKYPLANTTVSTMDQEFSMCQNWLVQNGLGRAANVLVWPNGSNSPQAMAEASKYFVTARGIVGTSFNTLPPANPMLLYATEIGNTVQTSTLDADVDRCETNHEWCIFYGHIITTSTPENQDQFGSSTFNDFVAHIASVGIPVKTITQVLSGESSGGLWSTIQPNLMGSTIVSPVPIPSSQISSSVSQSLPNLSLPYAQIEFGNAQNWDSTWGTISSNQSSFTLNANATTTGASVQLTGSTPWTNYVFSSTFDWVKGQNVDLLARYINDENYTLCEFDSSLPGSVGIRLEQYINGVRYDLGMGRDSVESGVGEKNINASIRVYDTSGACSFNNHYVIAQEGMTINPPFHGGIGFSMWDPALDNTEIVVKNVSVNEAY